MSETKMFAVICCAAAVFGISAVIATSIKEGKVGVEKEKTEQLKLQFKIDSLNVTQKK